MACSFAVSMIWPERKLATDAIGTSEEKPGSLPAQAATIKNAQVKNPTTTGCCLGRMIIVLLAIRLFS
jgi:hypothetical protein